MTPILPAKLSSHTISAWAEVSLAYPDGPFFIASDRYGASCDYKYTIVIEKTENEGRPTFTHYAPGFIDRSGLKGLKGESRTLENGKWVHVVGTYDLKNELLTLYVDEKAEKEMSIENNKGNAVWSNLPNPTSIGCWRGCQSLVGANDLVGFSKGKIDDMRFYNRALSAKEVEALHEQERPKE